jgi:hypothetical protein
MDITDANYLMPTLRPFAYNPSRVSISGTTQIGDLCVGTPFSGFSGPPVWWNGPDEDLGYVVAQSVPDNSQPTNVSGQTASVGFFRTDGFLENDFIELSELISSGQTFNTGNEAYLWLSGNGYWSSWNFVAPTATPTPTATPIPPTATPTATPTPTPTTNPIPESGVTFSQAFTGATAPSSAIETAWNTFRSQLTGTTYTQFVWSSTNGNSITVSDPTLVQTLANGLRTATITSVTINSVSWRVGTGCGTPKIGGVAVEFSNIASCNAGSTYALRPMINNANWGGTNQSTVGAPSQTITLTFS